MAEAPNFVLIHIAQGEPEANIIKLHLESEGIPVLLKYGGGGRVFGLTVDGWGEIEVLVPQELAEEAKHIIEPQEAGRAEE
jgi:hypothetical protein